MTPLTVTPLTGTQHSPLPLTETPLYLDAVLTSASDNDCTVGDTGGEGVATAGASGAVWGLIPVFIGIAFAISGKYRLRESD